MVITRKDIATLTDQELTQYKQVIEKMYKNGWMEWFSDIHNRHNTKIHNNSMFLPFHRRMTRDFEIVAQQNYDPNFAIPYWDASKDFANPQNSLVLTDKYIGGDGGASSSGGGGGGGCIANGFQKSWSFKYPNPHCLVRKFNGKTPGSIEPWPSPEIMESVLQRFNRLSDFDPNIQFTIHGSVHLGLGGDMTQTWAPNDAAFFLLHAYVDKLWWRWQSKYGNLWQIDGPGPNGITNLSADDLLINYEGETIRSVLELGYGKMCYQYDSDGIQKTSTATAGPFIGVNRNVVGFGGEGDVAPGLKASNLSGEDLKRFFPKSVNNSSSIGGGNTNNAKRSSNLQKRNNSFMKRKYQTDSPLIPIPPPLPDSWINMMKYKKELVQKVYKEMVELIEILNKSDYISPYF
ncbi:hypothetical protein H4219_003549 [Mycoemilia scoparia]|uniref:Tyrosinase copper-binding domain-containing protein n=1 Tax=Mycoemilia scoparia TaxID=417184 RepID=A0A9W7ZYI4_9FUNG|nr:hypothetical protein H4219_003549 [Mycoemilia scoparia]